MLEHLAERGYVCVTANYALSPKARWPQHVLDCKLALAWVKRHIAEYGGDPSLVFVSGGSAGGHLAALVALTANDPAWQPGFEDERHASRRMHPALRRLRLRRSRQDREPQSRAHAWSSAFSSASTPRRSAAASPISRVGESAPPFLVVHGRNDVLVPVATARAFVSALRAQQHAPGGLRRAAARPARLRQLLVAPDRAPRSRRRAFHDGDRRAHGPPNGR